MAIAYALPAAATEKLMIIGGGGLAGIVEAAAYRVNKPLGMGVTFVGGVLGIIAAMTMTGAIANLGTGVAASSAGSVGHMLIGAAWPAAKRIAGSREQIPSPRERVPLSSGVGASESQPAPVGMEDVIVSVT